MSLRIRHYYDFFRSARVFVARIRTDGESSERRTFAVAASVPREVAEDVLDYGGPGAVRELYAKVRVALHWELQSDRREQWEHQQNAEVRLLPLDQLYGVAAYVTSLREAHAAVQRQIAGTS
jgi:hypothetical protein